MESIFNKFLGLMTSFDKNDVEYIVIGGLAINLHGFARNTEDIDLFIQPSRENIENLRNSLFEIFHDDDINEITFEELLKYPVIRYISDSGIYIDIIVKLGETFNFSDLHHDTREINGVKIKFADLQTLYKLKEKTYREIDQLDLKFLKSKLDKNGN